MDKIAQALRAVMTNTGNARTAAARARGQEGVCPALKQHCHMPQRRQESRYIWDMKVFTGAGITRMQRN